MAALFADCFDHYAVADIATFWTQRMPSSNGDTSTITNVGRHSSNGFRFSTTSTNDATDRLAKVLVASGATAIVGYAIKCVNSFGGAGTSTTETGQASVLLSIRQGGTTQVWFRLNTNGTVSCYRGTTLLGTTSLALFQNTQHFIEFKVTVDNSSGVVQVRFDGITVLNLSSQDTQSTGSATWDELAIGAFNSDALGVGAQAVNTTIDDLYVCDGSGSDNNDFLGDVRVDAHFPNAAGNSSQWTRSTGSDQWATIDEAAANGDTDYNSSATVGHLDTLNFPALSPSGAAIKFVQAVVQASKTDAGAVGLKLATRISSTDYLGTEQGVPATYAFLRQIWGVSPATSSAWTESEFNAAEFGYQKSS